MKTIQRGEVHWVQLDPARGSEMAKCRPIKLESDPSYDAVMHELQRLSAETATPPKGKWASDPHSLNRHHFGANLDTQFFLDRGKDCRNIAHGRIA